MPSDPSPATRDFLTVVTFYQLVEIAVPEPAAAGGEELVVYSRGERFSLGRL
jgi:hypothetical protein